MLVCTVSDIDSSVLGLILRPCGYSAVYPTTSPLHQLSYIQWTAVEEPQILRFFHSGSLSASSSSSESSANTGSGWVLKWFTKGGGNDLMVFIRQIQSRAINYKLQIIRWQSCKDRNALRVLIFGASDKWFFFCPGQLRHKEVQAADVTVTCCRGL